MPIDAQRFFNRSLPQTLQVALFLLYFRAFFGFFEILVSGRNVDLARALRGDKALLVLLLIVVLHVAAGYLTATEKKVGYYLAIGAALSPLVFNYWLFSVARGWNIIEKLSGGSIISLIFDVALIALVLHPMSRSYQRIWFK
jgi:hypothetical protein